MGDFFKPWRRKIGVVTFEMACLAMADWVRSLISEDDVHDFVEFIYGCQQSYGLATEKQSLDFDTIFQVSLVFCPNFLSCLRLSGNGHV